MKKLLFRVFVCGILCSCAIAQKQATSRFSEQCDKMLSGQFKSSEPGAAALVARKGRILYAKAFGMANMELGVPMQVGSVFKIGSITKQFTAVAILQLVEKGKIHLEDEITKFIPDYPTRGTRITIEHLLTHTSGIRNYATIRDTTGRGALDFTPREMVDYFKNEPMRFEPGTKWEYSNSGYVLLGAILEQVTGKSYGDYLEENIFKPVGMSHSYYAGDKGLVMNRADGYAKNDRGFVHVPYLSMTQPYAAGSILSTVEDLFRWNRALLSGRLVGKEMLAKAWSRYKLADGTETNYGYGWRLGFIQESPSLWHGGLINGFITMALYLPTEDVFVAVFSNSQNNSPEDVTARLAALAIGNPYEFHEIPTNGAAQYAGVYEGDNGQLRVVSESGGKLYSQLGRGTKTMIHAYGKDKFFFEDDPFMTVAFERNDRGEINGLVMRSREAMREWKKSEKAIPSMEGISLDQRVTEAYIGEYEIRPTFTFSVTRENERLFVQATGQQKFEMFAESETKFFLKVNDTQFEFVRDDAGKVQKVVLRQNGRTTEAGKIR